jgi:hypothetical protein
MGTLQGSMCSSVRMIYHTLLTSQKSFGYPLIQVQSEGRQNWRDQKTTSEHRLQDLCFNYARKGVQKPWSFAALQIRQRVVWNMSSGGHVGRAMKEVERTLAEVDASLKSKVKEPMTPYHRPELGETLELDRKRTTIYQVLVGILCWACELGRAD